MKRDMLGSRVDGYDLLVFGSIIIYGVAFSSLTLLKHYFYYTNAWDLGNLDQALYTTLHGKFMYYTAELYVNLDGSYFASHISPLLILLVPFYAILPTAQTLLVLKSFGLAAAAYPLYLLARLEIGSKKIASTLALLYLLYPALQASNWFDFHPVAFLPLFIFSSYYFLRTKRWIPYFVTVALSLMVEEHVSAVLFLLSAFVFLKDKKSMIPSIRERRASEALVAVATMSVSAVWLVFALHWKGTFPVVPQFFERIDAVSAYDVLGTKVDPLFVPGYVLLNPLRVFGALLYDFPIKLFYLVLLLAPLVFLPLRSRLTLIALLLVAPLLLSNYLPYYALGAQYPLYLIPVVFLAATDGLKGARTRAQFPILKAGLVVTVLLAAITSPISPLSAPLIVGSGGMEVLWYPSVNLSPTARTSSLNRMVNLIPRGASVLTQNHLFPHFSNSLTAYVLPVIPRFENDTQYVEGQIQRSDYVLLDLNLSDPFTSLAMEEVVASRSFGAYAVGGGSVLFKKGYHGPPIQVSALD